MYIDMNVWKFGCFSLLATVVFVGCGQQSTPVADDNGVEIEVADSSLESNGFVLLAVPSPDEAKDSAKKGKVTKASATGKTKPTLLPKALFGKKADKAAASDDAETTDNQDGRKPLEKGSPEWLLNEIQRVRLLPLPQEEMAEDDEDDEDEKKLTPEQEEKLVQEQEKKFAQEIERTKGIRRERNQQIIKLAEECMQKTNKNAEQEPLFCAAVHNFLDARLQLALQGDAASIEALYEADKVFFSRNPKSESAAEAALTLVNLTHANARRYGLKDPRWLKEFSKHSQSYATRFPDESRGSVTLLAQAAKICELFGQIEEANACYQLLSSKYKDTPQGQQAVNVLRRLDLKGHELELSGPGIDGSEINVRTMKGKMVLIVFWESNAQPFVQQLPKLIEITKKYRDYLTVVGVNLDTSEKAVDAFLENHRLEWQQIFPENRQQRGWNSPLAVNFGVHTLPTMFLLDPNGIVAETNLDSSNLEAKIREVYKPFRKKTAAAK